MSLKIHFHRSWIEDEEISEVVDTLKSGWLTTGPKAFRFEEDFKNYIGCKHAIGLNSCTAGLHLSLVALGFKPGDEVITTPITFPATANVVIHERLKPVFADVEAGTLNIDAGKIEAKITPRTRAIMVVHFAGHACDMDPIEDLARRHNLIVIEDAAHALETRYKGKKVGNLGHLTSFSFYATKNITTGEGGMLTTNDDELEQRLRILRLHGLSRDAWKRYGGSGFSHWELHEPGFKYNMPDINAALGIHQLRKVERFMAIRKSYVERYDAAFRDVPEIETLQTREYTGHAHHLYVIALRLERLSVTRDRFLDAVQEAGVGVAVHFGALHLQPFYRREFHTRPEDCPVATSYHDRILSLPLYPKMTPAEVDMVTDTVKDLVVQFRR
jgi:dTDP-4-amino-4,6-dideoxygalactose transaminase